jgi:hypothetical protein
MVSFFIKKKQTHTMNVAETLVESGYRELDPYLGWGTTEEIKGFDVRYHFSDEELPWVPERNKGKYKYSHEFYFFFSVVASAKSIDIVVYFTDRNVQQAMGNLEEEEFIRDLVDLIKEYIDDENRGGLIKRLENEAMKAGDNFIRRTLNDFQVTQTVEDFLDTVRLDEFSTFTATTLENSGMFLFKFQNFEDFEDKDNKLLRAFKSFLEKTAALKDQKRGEGDKKVFTAQIDTYISRANLVLALATHVQKNDRSFMEINGYVFCKMDTDRASDPKGEILLLQSFVPDALTKTQYHEVDGRNLFGTMLVSLVEDVMYQRGVKEIFLFPERPAVRFYTEKMGYSERDSRDSPVLILKKLLPRRTKGRLAKPVNPPDVWKEILLQRKKTKRNIQSALRLVRGNTVAAAQLMHFYLKRKMT